MEKRTFWWLCGAVATAIGCGSVSGHAPDAGTPGDAAGGDSGAAPPVCAANQALRCDGNSLVHCNASGTAEVSDSCPLGCNATGPRCNAVNPSNGLAAALDMTDGEPDLDLGTTATLNTDDGTVQVDGQPVVVHSVTLVQISAPTIRVFIVHSLVTTDVAITGSSAIAVVSSGDIQIHGVFAASAHGTNPGAGRLNDGTCQGTEGTIVTGGAVGGSGGGGFGSSGAGGGIATNSNGTATGGAGGTPTGNAALVPLRGGCDSARLSGAAGFIGGGGGAIQLVSRTKIVVSGVVAANGGSSSGGGSGGGILLEAPVVEVPGNLVANGAAGNGGCLFPAGAEDGRLDATPATGSAGCGGQGGQGGNGAAGNSFARAGIGINGVSIGSNIVFGGSGGGGGGRIRVNTVAGGLKATGIFSPNPSTGNLASR